MFVMGLSGQKGAPPGLTAYEYYRYGACNLASDWRYHSFYDLDEVKQAFEKATQLDPAGYIGQLAHRCEISELPHMIPNQAVLDRYKEVVAGRCTDHTAKQNLEYCISQCPQFDWAYSDLAELNIRQADLNGAKKLLDEAAAINSSSINYLLVRAQLQSAQGNRSAALETLHHVLNIDPFYIQVYQRLLPLLLAPW